MKFEDLNGSLHVVEVTAESLYEAAALAIQAFKQAKFVDPNRGAASRLEIEVRQPAITHVVTASQVMRWRFWSSDPREGNRKAKLAELLRRQVDRFRDSLQRA